MTGLAFHGRVERKVPSAVPHVRPNADVLQLLIFSSARRTPRTRIGTTSFVASPISTLCFCPIFTVLVREDSCAVPEPM